MYTYNKNDKSYTFSSDELDIDNLVNLENDSNSENTIETDSKPEEIKKKKIEVINGGNDLNISPVSNYIEIEKPKNTKRENIVIPEDKK